MSVIARCAATPSTCDSRNDVIAWTIVAAPAATASGTSSSARCFADHVVDQILRRGRQNQPGHAVDQHQHEPERQPSAARGDQRARFLPGVGVVDRFLLARIVGASGDPGSACSFASAAVSSGWKHGVMSERSDYSITRRAGSPDRVEARTRTSAARERGESPRGRRPADPELRRAGEAPRILKVHSQLGDDRSLDDVAEHVLLDLLVADVRRP